MNFIVEIINKLPVCTKRDGVKKSQNFGYILYGHPLKECAAGHISPKFFTKPLTPTYILRIKVGRLSRTGLRLSHVWFGYNNEVENYPK